MTHQTISKKVWKTVKLDKPTRRVLLGIDVPVIVTEFTKEMQEAVRLNEVDKEIKGN